MIQKILIAEDIDSINTGIITILKDNFSFEIEHANSCDNAYLKLIKAIQNKNPFDLLISDISFKTDGLLTPILQNGIELVDACKKIQPELKTIVYTIEDKPAILKTLIEDIEVDALVLKGLKSLNELCAAIEKITKGEKYFTQEVQQIAKNDATTDIDEFDILLLDFLSQGLTQNEISESFKNKAINPCSISAIEKKINRLKTTLRAKNNIQMIAIAKDLALI